MKPTEMTIEDNYRLDKAIVSASGTIWILPGKAIINANEPLNNTALASRPPLFCLDLPVATFGRDHTGEDEAPWQSVQTR
jgi:hypothetical protein